ncbi:MAG: PDZ domain-containing protein [Planctomycetales bacterium]|nr:PDZ domain-containing protein [Planctomycetales bacterium]
MSTDRKTWKLVAFGATLVILAVNVAAYWNARQDTADPSVRFVKGPRSLQTRNDADILSGIVDSDGWNEGKNHVRIKSALSPAVSDASKATVRLLHRGDSLAMGTMITADGYLLTKASEVEAHQTKLVCRLYDGQQYRARLAGILDRHDLALLKIDAANVSHVTFDPDVQPTIGSIIATPSLTSRPVAIGVVSSQQQRVESDGVLGVRMIQKNGKTIVSEVLPGSSAARAGIHEGDIVIGVDGQQIGSMMAVVRMISTHLPGDEISFEVTRDDEPITFSAVLGRRDDLDVENGDFQSYLGGDLSSRRSGFPSVIQHDTFLLPEHCGGPIVDLEGRVVGLNIARAERIASYALPNNVVAASIKRMLDSENETDIVAK